jgi:PAS domain S-box-containing protein
VVFELAHDPGSIILWVNGEVERLLGWPHGRWLDDPSLWFEVLHPDDRDATTAAWRAAVESGTEFDREYRMRHADGRWIWVRDVTRPIRDADGSIVRWRGVINDITRVATAERELRRSEARYRTLVEQLPSNVYAVEHALDPDVLYCSPTIEPMLGIVPTDLTENRVRWAELIHPDDREAAWGSWEHAVLHEERFDAEYRALHADGSIVWVRDTCELVRDADGSPAFWQGVMHDVTSEKRAEAELRASETWYRTLVEQLPAVIYVESDEPEPRTLYVSPNVREILGYEPDFYVGTTSLDGWIDLVHPDDRERVYWEWTQWGEPATFISEYRLVRPDGEAVWVRDTSRLVQGLDGDRRYWHGVLLDVGAEKQAEEERRAAERAAMEVEARYRALVEGVPAVVYEMGPDDERRTLYVSHRIEELLGYTREEWLDQPDIWVELLHPDDRETELAAHDLHNQTGEPWSREYRLIAADGRVVWVRDQAALVHDADGQPLTWQGVMLDITAQREADDRLRRANDELEFRVLARTAQLADANELMQLEIEERRRAESKLRSAEERYRRLLEDAPAVIYTRQTAPPDPEGDEDWPYVSPQIEQMLGYTPREWSNGPIWTERLHPHDREVVLAAAAHSHRTGEPFEVECRYLAKDGRIVWVFDRATLLSRNAASEPHLFQGVMIDITARKEAEQKAARAEERYRQLTERGPIVTYSYELLEGDPPAMCVGYVSPQIADIIGAPGPEWIGEPEQWFAMVHPDDRDEVVAATKRAWATGSPWSIRYRTIAGDGRIVWFSDRGSCVERDDAGRPRAFQGVLLDVTSEAEEQSRVAAEAARLRDLMEGIPAIPWTEVVDATSGRARMVAIGPQSREILGYAPEELLAEREHFFRILHPDDRVAITAASEESDRTGNDWNARYRVIRRDGEIRWLHSVGHRVTPEDADVHVWHGVALDVTGIYAGNDDVPSVEDARGEGSTTP